MMLVIMMNENRPCCLVLMPFTVKEQDLPRYQETDHWSQVYEGLVVPAVQEAGLQCDRDDGDLGSRIIADNILSKIERSDLILCDLSSHNPNVFLELGWALRADRPYILIKDDLTKYAFDLNQQYTFTYSHRLQPIQLAKEVKQLVDVVRRTRADQERRYSIVGRLSLSFATIEAAKGGDVQAEMLMEIKRSLAGLRGSAAIQGREAFPWPPLLERASYVLSTVVSFIADAHRDKCDAEVLRQGLGRIGGQLGIGKAEDIQFCVIDLTGRIIYHDWFEMIGGNLVELSHVPDVFKICLEKTFGVFAWVDRTSHIRERIPNRPLRRNIGIFATAQDTGLIVVVEVHSEIE